METNLFKDMIERFEDETELREQQKLNGIAKTWKEKIAEFLSKKEISKSDAKKIFIKASNIQSAEKWINHVPAKRENILKIAYALQLNIEETNLLLQKYGKFHALYAKDPFDAIWIFLLSNIDSSKSATEAYNETKSLCSSFFSNYSPRKDDNNKKNTRIVSNEISLLKNTTNLIKYFEENINEFYLSGYKAHEYISKWCGSKNFKTMLEDGFPGKENAKYTVSSLESYVSGLKTGKSYPEREKLIFIGLALRMPLDQLDEMLKRSGMIELYAKDKFEGLIIYKLEEYMLNFPSLFDIQSVAALKIIKETDPYFSELCESPDSILEEGKTLADYVYDFIREYYN